MKTEIVKIRNKGALIKAISVLQRGGLIIYPTETCYGIGADATNNKAVLKVIKVKKRPKEKKIPLAVSSLKMARKYLLITKEAEKLVKAFMPGPLTLVVESKEKNKIGFRIPKNRFVLSIIRKFGRPITTTSANISGAAPLYRISDVTKTFNGKADLIVNAGNLPRKRPSTVFDMRSRKVLRKGPVPDKQIQTALDNLN